MTMVWGRCRPDRSSLKAGALALGLSVVGAPAGAQDAAFQGFFAGVCTTAAGTLAARCAETPAGGGALAGDSQESLNPSQALSATDAALARARALAAETRERLEQIREAEAGRPVVEDDTVSYGSWSLLVGGRGEWFDRNRDRNDRERGYRGETWGLQLGADHRGEDGLVLGGIFRFDRTDSDFDADAPARNFVPAPNEGGSESSAFNLTLFAAKPITDSLYVDGEVGIGHTDYLFLRDVVFLETTRTTAQTDVRTRGRTDGRQYSLGAGIGWDLNAGAASFGPYARTRWVRTTVEGYTEQDVSGSGLAMTFGDNRTTSWTSVVGARASYALSRSWGVVLPQVRVEWEHEYRDDPSTVVASFAQDPAGTQFALRGDEPDRDYFNVGAGLLFVLPNGWMPYLDYETLLGYDDLSRHRISAGLRAEF